MLDMKRHFADRFALIMPWAVACAAMVFATGCASLTIEPRTHLIPAERVYSDQDWARVLQDVVRDGLVDYQTLSVNREPLERYYALLSVTGPGLTPDQFTERNDRVAYWVNSHNALVLLAVLGRYPISTMYDLSLPSLAYDYRFTVDGRPITLSAIEDRVMAESTQDVRALFAMSGAALATPRLMSEPLRASTLEAQLTRAAAQALDSPHICQVDHATKSILVWQRILQRSDDFVAYWQTRRRVQTANVYSVLLDLATPQKRRALQSAVGYRFREMPFDRQLNEWTTRSGRPAVP